MKKILILIFICVLSGTTYAQDLTVTFAGNKANITIGEKTFDTNSIIDVRNEIDSIKIEESPYLNEKQKHSLKINGVKVDLSSEANLSKFYVYKLSKPFTLQISDVITVFRGETLCGTFYVERKPISEKDVRENVKFKTDDIKLIKPGEKRIVEAELENSLNLTLENVKVLIGNKGIHSDFKDNKLKFELSLGANEDSVVVKIKYTVKELANPKEMEYALCTVEIEQSNSLEDLFSLFQNALPSINKNVVFGGISAVVLLVIILGTCWWFKKSIPIETRGHKTLRLLIGPSGRITHGNKALMTGTFESLDGYIYKLKRQKWYSIFSHICFIGVKIECTGNNSFILDISCEAGDNVGRIHYNNGITDRIITVGMKAYDDGVFVLDDKSEIIIEGGKIHEVKKHIISIRNTSHYITLNAEEPQVNDFVTPKSNKKQYSIDTLDGIRFDIFNNRIQKISNLTNTTTNQIELVATNGKTIIVIPNGNVPAVGDIAIVAEGEYIVENVVYVIEGGKIKSITSHKEEQYTQSELIEIVKQLREENHKLQSRPTQESFELLKDQNEKVKAELVDLKKKYENVDKAIETAKSEAKIEEKKRLDSIHKKDIIDNYISIIEHKQKLNKAEKLTKEAVDAKENSEKALKLKETELNAATDKISGLNKIVLDKETEIITQKATIAKFKEAALKKNVHFVYQVQETLEEISNTFKDVYKDMTNSTIKEGFISPMLKGVSGLGAGILSWAEDYTVKVKGDSEGFFGGDFMSMKEEDVKEIISKKFISNIVKSDSFSKFVRLYQLSSVPFIRKQLVEAGMNIDVLNKLYYKVYTLVSDFDYQIICPKLFEEQHSDKKYQWFNSTNLFNIINLPEEEKKAIKELGPETIIDVNQIGFISPWASRNATAVTSDF